MFVLLIVISCINKLAYHVNSLKKKKRIIPTVCMFSRMAH